MREGAGTVSTIQQSCQKTSQPKWAPAYNAPTKAMASMVYKNLFTIVQCTLYTAYTTGKALSHGGWMIPCRL